MVLGKVKALAIYFDSLNENNLPVFSGGDLVSGRVVVEVTGDVRVKSLDINARGVAKVRWTESRNAGANTAYTQNYTEEVEYLHHYDTLIGEERGKVHVSVTLTAAVVVVVAVREVMQQLIAANFLSGKFQVIDNFLDTGGRNYLSKQASDPQNAQPISNSGADATADSWCGTSLLVPYFKINAWIAESN